MDITNLETGNETIDNGIEKAGNFLTNAFSKAVEFVQDNPEAAMGAAAGFLFGGVGGAALGAGLGYLAKQFFGAANPAAVERAAIHDRNLQNRNMAHPVNNSGAPAPAGQ